MPVGVLSPSSITLMFVVLTQEGFGCLVLPRMFETEGAFSMLVCGHDPFTTPMTAEHSCRKF